MSKKKTEDSLRTLKTYQHHCALRHTTETELCVKHSAKCNWVNIVVVNDHQRAPKTTCALQRGSTYRGMTLLLLQNRLPLTLKRLPVTLKSHWCV